MPRIVDHDQRRRQLTDAAAVLVATQGRSALTVRNVAAAVGCSTKVVSHYFADMAELLHATHATAAARARARVDAVRAADASDIQGFIEALLPLDDVRRGDWRIWFAFWSEALSSERLGRDQRERARATVAEMTTMLRTCQRQQRLDPRCDPVGTARRLAALISGIASQAIFDPSAWTPTRQRAVVADELALVGLGPRRG